MARILIIDDDYQIVAILTEILNREGFMVDSAADPVTGMQKTRTVKPDLIILDYHMPGNTGAHLYESLRRNNSTQLTPVLFISGEATPELIQAEISEKDSVHFLPKPVPLVDFRNAVKKLLSIRKDMGKLVLVRHGQSQWNLENRFTGWVDVPITEKGEQEAHRAGKELKNIQFDVAFTSVLQRAQQTLKIILEECGQSKIPIVADAALNERHYGDLQGLNKAETAKKYGEQQVHIWRRSYDIKPPNGESLKDTAARTLPYFIKNILPLAAGGKNVLVSAHGNSLRAIVMSVEELSADEILKVEIATGHPIIYDILPNGKVQEKSQGLV